MLGLFKQERHNVALVLSCGGAKGLAHVGAIDSLIAHGYNITSVAGTSMGALVGGIFTSGHLDDFKQWMESIDRKRVHELTDLSLSFNHLIKGVRIIDELKKIVPDTNIESLPIPFCAIATDWVTGREVVFTKGSLWAAIRASISEPVFFAPVKKDNHILIDGGITNPYPLNRVKRTRQDLLVGVNVSGHDYEGIYKRDRMAEQWQLRNNKVLSLLSKLLPEGTDPKFNYFTLLNRTVSIAISQNARKAVALNPPDINVEIPMKRYGGSDYDKYAHIRKIGESKMDKAIDKFQQKRTLF